MAEHKDPVNEIERLIDELESFAEKSPWYLPSKIVIRDEDFFRITQRIRELLPSELAEASKLLSKRDLILKNAQDEHRRILESAEERLRSLTSEEQIVVAAREEAEKIMKNALAKSEELKREALVYTAELLTDMEQQFQQTMASIRKGREFLEEEITEQVETNLSGVPADGPETGGTQDAPE